MGLLAARRWRRAVILVIHVSGRRCTRTRFTSASLGSARRHAHAIAQEVTACFARNVLRAYLAAAGHLDRLPALLHEGAPIFATYILSPRIVAAISHGAWTPARSGCRRRR
jgi:hypothetical protein